MHREQSRVRGVAWPGPHGPTLAGPSAVWTAGHRVDTADVFARYFIELPLPSDVVERVLVDGSAGWLPGLAEHADRHGEALMAEVGFGDDVRVHHRVEVELGTPIRMATTTVLPLRWTATGVAPRIFPSMDADLEIAQLGPAATQLAMSARYTPPLGGLGRVIDRAVLHRVAEATLKDFMDRLRVSVLEHTAA